MQLLYQCSSIGTNYWLNFWANGTFGYSGEPDNRDLYLGVYGGFGLVQAISVMILTISLSITTLDASKVNDSFFFMFFQFFFHFQSLIIFLEVEVLFVRLFLALTALQNIILMSRFGSHQCRKYIFIRIFCMYVCVPVCV